MGTSLGWSSSGNAPTHMSRLTSPWSLATPLTWLANRKARRSCRMILACLGTFATKVHKSGRGNIRGEGFANDLSYCGGIVTIVPGEHWGVGGEDLLSLTVVIASARSCPCPPACDRSMAAKAAWPSFKWCTVTPRSAASTAMRATPRAPVDACGDRHRPCTGPRWLIFLAVLEQVGVEQQDGGRSDMHASPGRPRFWSQWGTNSDTSSSIG